VTELLAIALGGALGAVARFLLGNASNNWFGTEFPYGILLVNILGSLIMGILFVILVEKSLLPAIWFSRCFYHLFNLFPANLKPY